MTFGGADAQELSAALLELEDHRILDADAASVTTTRVERRAAALGDERLLMRARYVRALLIRRSGDIAGSIRQCDEVLNWATEHRDRRLQARAHTALSATMDISGDIAGALEHALSAVELLDETATPYMHVAARCQLAGTLSQSGDMAAARVRYQQAEEMARKLQERDWDQLLLALNNWACDEYDAGELLRAGEVADRMQKHASKHGLELNPQMLDTIAGIQIANGEYAEAEQVLLVCISRHEAGKTDTDADFLANYLLTLARAQRGLDATGRAQQSLDAARRLCTDRGLLGVLVQVHQEQAELHAACGDYARAFAAQKVCLAAREDQLARQEQEKALTRHAKFETTEARDEADRFREQARRDPLTGLHNRRYADEELPALIAADPDLCLAIVDIDHFKRINDQLSHETGDQVLIQVAKILDTELAAASPGGFTARLGGEEFLLVLPNTLITTAVRQLDEVRQAVAGHDWRGTTSGLPVTVSIGVTAVRETTPHDQTSALATADRNLYAAKHAGRNRVVTGTPPEPRPRAYRDREAGLITPGPTDKQRA
ncbi:diguanylate cyclase [Krasilnikovia sp. MM14-A1004]|uniref:GGDEF domain-containing protein n=1 Tax=Krasilnikovia sp. MM14-A1004 TaxID=3373541 RepID=UPI00399C55AE